ncbi:MAG TPA: S8 family serine peptidase [Pyrinomonadaceae bacterium]|nr:S8 family serine peptidase [Pyrinomonadaceae bacterium]
MPRGKRSRPLGNEFRKFQPKLRMFANCDSKVNALRAEHAAAVAMTETSQAAKNVPIMRGDDAVPLKRGELGKTRVGRLKSTPSDVLASVFIETLDASVKGRGRFPGQRAQKGNLITARVPLSQLKKIAADENVLHVELGDPLTDPNPVVLADKVSEPPRLRFKDAANLPDGEGALIGIIDVQGFDFSHPDFLDANGKTRFVRIWDQGATKGSSRPHPKSPPGTTQFDYGAEFRQEHLNAAIANSPRLGLPPYELERQTQMVPGSHATHVASIAAGNRGVAPKAMIAGVLVSLPPGDLDIRRSFYDSTRIADAVDYLIGLARELSEKRRKPVPLSINVSLGTNGHAHDGSSAVSRWIDSAMSVPGRCICVAAGNAGQEAAQFEGDSGWVMGRIHTSGQIPARGLVKDIEWIVVGNGLMDLSENELEIWYSPQDRFAVQVRPPDSDEWIGPIEPREFIENRQLRDGSFLSIYNELYHPSNGANYISIYLAPLLSEQGIVGIPAGRWTVRLIGDEVRDGRYHGWIERDDSRPLGRVGPKEAWRFPSFFSTASNVDDSSVSSLACGNRVISVANLDEPFERINVTSSQGPTRDNRNKPDTAAPGTNIVAAKGFAGPKDLWVKMTGTSMASPFVAGVAALMLAAEPKLTAAQIEGIIVRTARPLPGGGFNWHNGAGFGRIDPAACIAEAKLIHERKDRTGRR